MATATLLLRCESGGGWPVYVDSVQLARTLAADHASSPLADEHLDSELAVRESGVPSTMRSRLPHLTNVR